MDYIEKLAQQASQITMYDVKSYYNQAKNAVLNVSEMEAKVREATNDDPWGASSTLMQQIADGTHNFAQFNEIMPTIYARFMEKEAREWRQIYKALTLLEFLVKNGSERVVDDARAHISTIKMLRSFHYIDEKSKDQGINVRNRASEIASLLADVDRIRVERRKAKSNKNKYSGTGSDGSGGMSFTTAGGGRYGGFGSESLGGGGGGSGGGYREGGSGSGSGRGYNGGDGGDDYRRRDRQDAPEYDEYEGADDFDEPSRRSTSAHSTSVPATSSGNRDKPTPPPKATPKKPAPPKEVNLFDFGDDEPAPTPTLAQPAANILGGDDDFDDFQQAPTSTTSAPAPAPGAVPAQQASGNANLFDLLNNKSSSTAAPAPAIAAQPATSFGSFGNFAPVPAAPANGFGGGMGMMSPAQGQPPMTSRPSYFSTSSAPPPKSTASKAGSSTFDDLFATSLSTLGKPVPTTLGTCGPGAGNASGKSMKDLEKEKAANSLWGTGTGMGNGSSGQKGNATGGGGGGRDFDDLLM